MRVPTWGEVFVCLFLPHLVSTTAVQQLQGHWGHSRVRTGQRRAPGMDGGRRRGRPSAPHPACPSRPCWSPAAGSDPAFAPAEESSIPPRHARRIQTTDMSRHRGLSKGSVSCGPSERALCVMPWTLSPTTSLQKTRSCTRRSVYGKAGTFGVATGERTQLDPNRIPCAEINAKRSKACEEDLAVGALHRGRKSL